MERNIFELDQFVIEKVCFDVIQFMLSKKSST